MGFLQTFLHYIFIFPGDTYPAILKWKIHGAPESGGYAVKLHIKVTPGGECEWFIGDPSTGDTGTENFDNCGDAGLYMGRPGDSAIEKVEVLHFMCPKIAQK